MSDPVLRLERLSKSFGALKVTDGIDLDILAGETHAIIGPNGAGKTTLIHQISGALAPDAGRILFDGRDVTALPMPARAQLGLARSFQITHVLPRFTALENVALAVQARSGSSFRFWQPAAAEEALNAPAMDALDSRRARRARADARPAPCRTARSASSRSPSRWRRRPSSCCSTSRWPAPAPRRRAGWSRRSKRLKRRYTIVLVEHDMQAVFALADRISVLVEGRIIATGTPDAVRANPAVRAAYLGEAA